MLYTHFLKAYVHAQNRERGATMVEYGVMVALIAAVSIAIITTLGGQVTAAFTAVSKAFP